MSTGPGRSFSGRAAWPVSSSQPADMDGTKSDQERASKRKADEDNLCSDTQRDQGSTQEIPRTSSNSCRTRFLPWLATWRADRTPVGRCGFLESRHSRSPFRCDDGSRHCQDRSFSKRCTPLRCSCRVSPQAKTDQPIQPGNQLCISFAHDKGQATPLAGHSLAAIAAAIADHAFMLRIRVRLGATSF